MSVRHIDGRTGFLLLDSALADRFEREDDSPFCPTVPADSKRGFVGDRNRGEYSVSGHRGRKKARDEFVWDRRSVGRRRGGSFGDYGEEPRDLSPMLLPATKRFLRRRRTARYQSSSHGHVQARAAFPGPTPRRESREQGRGRDGLRAPEYGDFTDVLARMGIPTRPRPPPPPTSRLAGGSICAMDHVAAGTGSETHPRKSLTTRQFADRLGTSGVRHQIRPGSDVVRCRG